MKKKFEEKQENWIYWSLETLINSRKLRFKWNLCWEPLKLTDFGLISSHFWQKHGFWRKKLTKSKKIEAWRQDLSLTLINSGKNRFKRILCWEPLKLTGYRLISSNFWQKFKKKTLKFGVFLLQMTETSLKWGQNLQLCKKTFPTFTGVPKIGVYLALFGQNLVLF